MTYEEIALMLQSTGLPVAYNAFPIGSVPALPYIVYSYPNSENFGADNYVYQRADSVRIWLCTAEKDFSTESTLEGVLNSNHVYWDKTESFEQNDAMYMVLYETEIVINNE